MEYGVIQRYRSAVGVAGCGLVRSWGHSGGGGPRTDGKRTERRAKGPDGARADLEFPI